MTRKTCCSDDPGPFVAKSGMGCGTIILVAVDHHPAHHPQPLLQLRPAGGELLVQFQLPQLGWLNGGYSSGGGHK